MLSCSTWFSAPSVWMGGVLESRCVGRVYGADGAVLYKGRNESVRHIQHKINMNVVLGGRLPEKI